MRKRNDGVPFFPLQTRARRADRIYPGRRAIVLCQFCCNLRNKRLFTAKLRIFFSVRLPGRHFHGGTCLAFRGKSGVTSLSPVAFCPFISGSVIRSTFSCRPTGFMVSCIFRFSVASSFQPLLISASLGHEAATIS